MALDLSAEMLARLRRDAEQRYPSECCGILLGPAGRPGLVTRVEPVANVQDAMHREDQKAYPRTSRRAYLMDPEQQLRILRESEAASEEVRGLYHSHPDERAYFSPMDRRLAAPWGEPLYPQASFVVLSVRKGRVVSAREFRWDEKRREFLEGKFGIGIRPPAPRRGGGRRVADPSRPPARRKGRARPRASAR